MQGVPLMKAKSNDQSLHSPSVERGTAMRPKSLTTAEIREHIAWLREAPVYSRLHNVADALGYLQAELEDWRKVGTEVLAGLDARVTQAVEAGDTDVPVFNGIADLHRLVHSASPSLLEQEG